MLSLGGSNVNRNKLCVALLALAALIVAPVGAIVNFNHKVNIAEGNPIPPPVPPVMVAEGNPIPPPVPPVMVAEGNPIPPPVPPVMVAEGNPIPPPVPPVAAFIV
jgi:hypothetical protein